MSEAEAASEPEPEVASNSDDVDTTGTAQKRPAAFLHRPQTTMHCENVCARVRVCVCVCVCVLKFVWLCLLYARVFLRWRRR